MPGTPDPGYAAPAYSAPNTTTNVNVNVNYAPPVGQLRTDRGLLKYILLSMITCGIYGLICFGNMTDDLNTIASRYDNKRTMNFYLLIFLVAPFTLGIGAIVWQHKMCARMGNELQRRGINYSFGAGTFWGWGVLGALILVGPLVFMHKFFTAMNKLCADFNVRG